MTKGCSCARNLPARFIMSLHIATLICVSKFFSTHGNQPISIDSILIAVQVSKYFYFLKPRFMQNIFYFLTGV